MKRWLDHLAGQIYVPAGLPSGGCLAFQKKNLQYSVWEELYLRPGLWGESCYSSFGFQTLLTYYDQ